MARGITIAIVPQEVPVAKATAADKRKVTVGKNGADRLPLEMATRKFPVRRVLQTSPMAQARTKTTQALII